MADIHLLRTFIAAYRTGTFTRAAQELHVTQPAVSMQIRALESQIGKPLFRRAPRGAVPTAAGHELAQAVAAHIDALEAALDPHDASFEAVGESLHIGGPEEFLGARVLPELAPLVTEGLRVRMFFGVDVPVLQRLDAGELDLAVLTVDGRRPGIESQPLCNETLELVAAPAWRDRLGTIPEGPIGAAALADVPIAAYDEDLPLVRLFWQTIFQTPATMRARFVANSLQASLHFATAGMGVTVLPVQTTAPALRRGELVRMVRPARPPQSRLFLAWRSGTLRKPTLARVQARITRAARGW